MSLPSIADHHPATILVVDDNEANRYATTRCLAAAEFRVLEASSANQAMDHIAASPDLIVLDIALPDVDGLELCRRLKANPATSHILILHLSAERVDAPARVRGLTAGADGYLTHPFDPSELVALVNALLRRRDEDRERLRARTDELETKYHVVFDHTPLPTWLIDADTLEFLDVNAATVRQYGYTRDEMLSMRAPMLLPPPDRDALVTRLASIGDTPEVTRRSRHQRKDGSLVDVEVVSHALTLQGRRTRLVTANDITASVRATDALRESEERYRALTENTTELISIVDGEGVFQYASPSYAGVLGYEPESLVGQPSMPLIHPDDVGPVCGVLGDILASHGQIFRRLVRTRHRAGAYRTLEVTGQNLLDHPAIRGIVCNSRDVTERETAEAERHVQAHLLDAVEQAVIATALDGTITYLNRFAQRLYGWPADEARGRHIGEVTSTGATRERAEEIAESLARGESWTGEFDARNRDGQPFRVKTMISPVRAIGGSLAGIVTVSIDLTRERAMEQQLQLSQKLEAVGKLAGGIAHDFNNLLTVISAHNQFLLAGLSDANPLREDTRAIEQATSRAAALTRQLLAFSRKQVLTPTLVDMNAVVDDTNRLLGRVVGEDIVVTLGLAPETRPVLVDVGQLQQVLMNLVINARDAMPCGGELSIRTRSERVPDGTVARGVVLPGDYSVLSVEDQGVGMDAETQARIFEPFFTTKELGQGTGLGLATVYGIVKQSGGYILVESAPGRGTTIDVYFPVAADDACEAAEPEHVASSTRGRETVLLVEDEPGVREIAKRILAAEGYRVIEANDGKEAMELCDAHHGQFDLTISDAVMPGITGIAVLAYVRAQNPQCKAMLMSGYTDDEMARRGIRSADVAFMPKPFTPPEFARAVRRVLDT